MNENFNVVQGDIQPRVQAEKKELVIKPKLLKGHVPIGSEQSMIPPCPKECPPKFPNKRGSITANRENVSKYIRKSMLLNKPNHNLGFLPSNVRFMELMYSKPTQIGKIPLFKMNVPAKIKLAKLTGKRKDEE